MQNINIPIKLKNINYLSHYLCFYRPKKSVSTDQKKFDNPREERKFRPESNFYKTKNDFIVLNFSRFRLNDKTMYLKYEDTLRRRTQKFLPFGNFQWNILKAHGAPRRSWEKFLFILCKWKNGGRTCTKCTNVVPGLLNAPRRYCIKLIRTFFRSCSAYRHGRQIFSFNITNFVAKVPY